MTAPRGGSAHDEGARPSDAADKEANKLSESPVDARSSQGVQINERGDNLQLNIFMNRADVGTPIATPDEFKADVVAMLENLDNAARRLHLPAFLPAHADVTRMARTVRFVGRVRRSAEIDEDETTFPRAESGSDESSSRERVYTLPADRDDREGEVPQPWDQVAASHDWLVVLADPGLGKSWLLRNETHRLAQVAYTSLRRPEVGVSDVIVPIPIRADMLAASQGQALAEAACNYLVAEGLLAARSKVLLEERINDGSVVLLIDALDEVPRDSTIPRAPDIAQKFMQCSGVL